MMLIYTKTGQRDAGCNGLARLLATVILSSLFTAMGTYADSLVDYPCTNSVGEPIGLEATTPSSDFEVVGNHQDGIVRHERTGLEWRRCPLGATFSDGECSSLSSSLTWQDALQEALAEGDDWRVPNVNELASIVEECVSHPAINEVVFPSTGSALYWTSTTGIQFGAGYAITINFASGSDSSRDKMDRSFVMLVRNGR